MTTACIKVNKRDAQLAKKALLEANLIDFERVPARDGEDVIFPVHDGADGATNAVLRVPFEFCAGKCPTSKKQHGNIAERLSRVVPKGLIDLVPRAFNIIGKIAVLEIDEQLLPFKDAIARELLEIHPHLSSIYCKESERTGEFRTSVLDLVWGDGNPVTMHAENGCQFVVDVKGTFFDPRLVHEHGRVIESIRVACERSDTRDVLDLFCGVGPFIIPIAKNTPARSWAVDLNPRAIELLETNVKVNRIDPARVHARAMD
ncbi:MAG: methyltransferase, partial [Candidatus Lokiarchaeota archaeon]|nr:methyltransferase [Candidatus Lokiarchaeota archaeon]